MRDLWGEHGIMEIYDVMKYTLHSACVLIYVCFCSLQPVVTSLPEESGGA